MHECRWLMQRQTDWRDVIFVQNEGYWQRRKNGIERVSQCNQIHFMHYISSVLLVLDNDRIEMPSRILQMWTFLSTRLNNISFSTDFIREFDAKWSSYFAIIHRIHDATFHLVIVKEAGLKSGYVMLFSEINVTQRIYGCIESAIIIQYSRISLCVCVLCYAPMKKKKLKTK